ncbi:putative exported protein [Halobacteriovorax marinus SJ]|uniref:Exported protein n=1 Tax=Halobacteriovorax marinus (strain ATCC BAA-682 / DSM 15412 / SJ) TaxID=862908 RepID=E1X3Z1_HALMS|nr:hypothetical protein [Halobacteriovorax marinus]CBW25331.1 putative exported protein [Halobacteriovorax marinus SJ]
MDALKLLLCFLISFNIFALEAQVIVLEAPLLSEPALKSKVLQRVRKGKNLYIHNQGIVRSPWEMNYNVNSNGIAIDEPREEVEFLKTFTRSGKVAWIPKKYVKVIYNDARESELKMNPYAKYDPTDYRIEEPLEEGYPLVVQDKARAAISFGIGPASKSGFNYGSNVLEENIGNRYSFVTTYTKKVDFDSFDRFYFGGLLQIHGQRSLYFITNDRTSQETHGEIGIGPYISYDVYRTEDRSLTTYGAFTYNLHRYTVEQATRDENFEERLFSGYSLTPKLGLSYNIRDIIPESKVDFVFGAETNFNLPYSLKTKTPGEIEEFWNNSDQVDFGFSATFSLYLGIVANY